MADKDLPGLTAGSLPLDGDELLYVVQGGNSRKVAGSEIVKIAHSQPFSSITDTPTTRGGYGITDAASSAQGDLADSALQPGDIGTTVQAHGATLDSLEGLSLIAGDILYATGSDALARLAKGSDGEVLKLASGVPIWGTAAGAGDMLAATYDPTAKAADAFDMGNMVEGVAAKIMTAAERTKLAGIADGAEVNVQSDWNAASGDAQILNKPTLGTSAALDVGTIAGTVAAGDDNRFRDLASQAEAEDGADNTKVVTALRVNEGIRYWMNRVNLFDHMSRAQITAYNAGTSETGMTAALQAAVNALPSRGGVLSIPGSGLLTMDTATASGMEARAIGKYNVKFQDQDDWRLEGEGATITAAPGANWSHALFMFRCAGFEVSGLKFVGDNTGLDPTYNNGAIFPYSCRDFLIRDFATSGFQGSHIVGNFQFNGEYRDFSQAIPSGASGFDIASWQNMTVRGQTAVGAGGGQGFQHTYDAPNSYNLHPEYNETGITLREGRSNNIKLIGCDISKCRTGIYIADAGGDIRIIDGSMHDCAGGGDSWLGILLATTSDAVADGGGAMVDVVIDGPDIYSNSSVAGGTSGLNGGIGVSCAAAEVQVAITSRTKIHDNYDSGVLRIDGTPKIDCRADFRARFGALQSQHVAGLASWKLPSASILSADASSVRDCPGYNPVGKLTDPTLPAGTGSANAVRNTNPFPVLVVSAGGSGVSIIDEAGNQSIDFGDGNAGTLLLPGYQIFYRTTVPSGWNWFGQ